MAAALAIMRASLRSVTRSTPQPAAFAAYSILVDAGRPRDAAEILQQWVARHPDDAQAEAMLRQLQGVAPGSIAPPGGPGGGGVPGGTP